MIFSLCLCYLLRFFSAAFCFAHAARRCVSNSDCDTIFSPSNLRFFNLRCERLRFFDTRTVGNYIIHKKQSTTQQVR
jgi:hypothetical protein